jgi:DNA-binding response OmpR family regulator
MPNQVGTSHIVRFATLKLTFRRKNCARGGLRLKLSGQSFQVLAILLERPGTVVTRDELQAAVVGQHVC